MNNQKNKLADKTEPYKDNFIHHQHRRKLNHDYREAWKYHITICKDPICPPFSHLQWSELTKDGVRVKYSDIGFIIWNGIKELVKIESKIQVYQYVIMPDHIHLLIRVKERLDRLLGDVLHDFKRDITSAVRKVLSSSNLNVFTSGFNDKIIYTHRNLEDIYEYIRQNPYRLAVRQSRPDFFIRQRNIYIVEREIQVYGNLFHLRNPFKYPLIVHRNDSDEIYQRKLNDCLYYAGNGGVVVSAFISPREKEIRRETESVGGRLIVIHNCPFGERENPGEHDFNLCAEGKLLFVSPMDYLHYPKSEHPSREQCLDMNRLAETISGKS